MLLFSSTELPESECDELACIQLTGPRFLCNRAKSS